MALSKKMQLGRTHPQQLLPHSTCPPIHAPTAAPNAHPNDNPSDVNICPGTSGHIGAHTFGDCSLLCLTQASIALGLASAWLSHNGAHLVCFVGLSQKLLQHSLPSMHPPLHTHTIASYSISNTLVLFFIPHCHQCLKVRSYELEKDRNQTKPNQSPVRWVAIYRTGLLQSSCQSFTLKNIMKPMKTGLNWLQPVHMSREIFNPDFHT
jgi:hypothetical protein